MRTSQQHLNLNLSFGRNKYIETIWRRYVYLLLIFNCQTERFLGPMSHFRILGININAFCILFQLHGNDKVKDASQLEGHVFAPVSHFYVCILIPKVITNRVTCNIMNLERKITFFLEQIYFSSGILICSNRLVGNCFFS